jgi:hypothetical protein
MAPMAAAYSACTPSTTFAPVTQSENGGGSSRRRGTSTPRAAAATAASGEAPLA